MSNSSTTGWPTLCLKNFIGPQTLFSDGDWVESKDQDAEGSNRLIQLADLGDGKFLDKSQRYMNDKQFSRLRCTELRKGDILIARMPEPLGRACLFPFLSQRCATVVDVAILRSPKADRDWLLYSINSYKARRQIETLSAGTTRTRISRNLLAEIQLLTPPPVVQEVIASILRLVDTSIEKTEALIEKYQQIKAGLMHDLFTRGIGADGKLRPPREQAPELYQETPIGWIPKEWSLMTIELAGGYVTSGSRDWAKYYSDDGDKFIRIGNLTREHINFRVNKMQHVTPPKNADGQRTKLILGDILVSITADLGIVGVIPEGFGAAYINQHIALIRFTDKKINPRFVGNYLSSTLFQKYLERLNDSGAKAGLNLPAIRRLPVVLPNDLERSWISDGIDSVDSQIESEKAKLRKFIRVKSGLMHDLLTGKVEVKIDQPEVDSF